MQEGERGVKASDIPDAVFLDIVRRYNEGNDETPEMRAIRERDGYGIEWAEGGRWAFVWDVAEALGVPGKVAEAKGAKLIKRGLMTGCDAKHWCRGDYEVTAKGYEILDTLPHGHIDSD